MTFILYTSIIISNSNNIKHNMYIYTYITHIVDIPTRIHSEYLINNYRFNVMKVFNGLHFVLNSERFLEGTMFTLFLPL